MSVTHPQLNIIIIFLLGLNIIAPAHAIEPSDVFYPQQIYLTGIKANQAWNITTGSNEVTIAILDTGINIDHPDLKDNIWRNPNEIPNNNIDDDHNGYIDDYDGWDFVTSTHDPRPKFDTAHSYLGMNHGTIVAGVAAGIGNNDIGIAGVNWHARIMALRVLNGEGMGSTSHVAQAIDYARQQGANIINLSFVGEGSSNSLNQAIERAYKAGILIVAAAGNEVDQGIDMTTNPRYPVCHDGDNNNNWIIGVASIDNSDHLASFSNYGKCVDILTPGVGVFSTLVKDDNQPRYEREYGGYWSGTSVSAPQVAGTAALLKSLKPKLTLLELTDLILDNTDNINNKNQLYTGKLGYGKLNTFKAVVAAQNTTSQAESLIDKIIVSPGVGGGPHVRVFEQDQLYSQFFAFDDQKRFGANAVGHDLNQDGLEEIIVTAETGEEPWVKIFDIKGNPKAKFLAMDANFKGGLELAVGDVDGDEQDEIIVVPKSSSEPIVKIFNQTGELEKEFYALNKFFKNGLSVAVADTNHDHFAEIFIATHQGTSAYVKTFNYHGALVNQFIAFPPDFMGGINIAIGDLEADGQVEIIAAPRTGGPQLRVFDLQGRLKNQFFAYEPNSYTGVNITSGDINGDGQDEIITGPGPGANPQIRVFNYQGQIITEFMAYHPNFTGGVKVSCGK